MTFQDLVAMLQMAQQMPMNQQYQNKEVMPPGREYMTPGNYGIPQPGLRVMPLPGGVQSEKDIINEIFRRLYMQDFYKPGSTGWF